MEFRFAASTEPNCLARLGLHSFWQEVARHYHIMRHRKVEAIWLRMEADAAEAELSSAQETNAITVMAAALSAADDHRIVFLPPQEPSDEEKSTLRAVARCVYRDYSVEAHEALTRLAEGNRHFGTTRKVEISDRLLHSIGREVDPGLERMPVFVQAIEVGLARPSMRTFRVAS